jgi:hypothetical protein
LWTAKAGYLAGKIRIWPPLSDDLKDALVAIALRGTPITFRRVARLFNYSQAGIPPIISDLIKCGCLELHRHYSADKDAQLDLTPTGLVQALCADNRVWTNFKRILSHLKEKMPNLSRNWSTICHASRTASLRLLADAVQFTVSSRKWRDGNRWEAFEENFVLQVFKSLNITEEDRGRILRAVSNDSESRAFFRRTIDDLYKRAEITLEENHEIIRAIG